MPMNNVVVSKHSTEKEFISDFVKSIMSESAFTSQHTLVCKIGGGSDISSAVQVSTSTEVDTQLDTIYGTTSNTLNIWFIIDTNTVLNLYRAERISSGTSSYRVMVSFNGISGYGLYSYRTLSMFTYSGSYAPSYDEVRTRIFKYQIISNANVVFLLLGGYDATFPLDVSSSYCASMFAYKKGTEFACGLFPSSTLIGADGQDLQAVDRLPYINNSTNPTAIETIENKVVISSAGQNKVITMDNIWDSSYNPAVLFEVTVGNSTCVYLNNYTLMPITTNNS